MQRCEKKSDGQVMNGQSRVSTAQRLILCFGLYNTIPQNHRASPYFGVVFLDGNSLPAVASAGSESETVCTQYPIFGLICTTVEMQTIIKTQNSDHASMLEVCTFFWGTRMTMLCTE